MAQNYYLLAGLLLLPSTTNDTLHVRAKFPKWRRDEKKNPRNRGKNFVKDGNLCEQFICLLFQLHHVHIITINIQFRNPEFIMDIFISFSNCCCSFACLVAPNLEFFCFFSVASDSSKRSNVKVYKLFIDTLAFRLLLG